MKQEFIDRLTVIQEKQYSALATQDLERLSELESEKTQLLQEMGDFDSASDDQRKQLESVLATQVDLEKVCAEVRDELGKQIKQVLERHKAVSAYRDIE